MLLNNGLKPPAPAVFDLPEPFIVGRFLLAANINSVVHAPTLRWLRERDATMHRFCQAPSMVAVHWLRP